MATTKQVINDFLHGAVKGKASSISIDGDKLYNYDTVIAQRINGVVFVNITRYSMTTTKHQNVLRREMPNAPTVDNVPRGTYNLSKYVTVNA